MDAERRQQLRHRSVQGRSRRATTITRSENQLTIPVNRPVNVILRSQDVIHAFYVPEFRMYQDIVPGRIINWVWFTPEKDRPLRARV